MNEFAMFMKTHHGHSLAFNEKRGKYNDNASQMYWECWQSAQQSVQPTAFGVGMRARLGHWLVSLGQYLIQNDGG